MAHEERDPPTLEACREMLQHIDPGLRFNRIRAGEALKDEFGDAGFELFDAWYSAHTRYTAREAKEAWRSFGKGGGKPCTIGTLIYEAQRGGFKFQKQHQAPKRSPEERKRAQAEKLARRKALEEEAAAEAAAAAARALAIWDAADQDPAGHGYLERKGINAIGVRRAREWVKEWTDPASGEIKTFRYPDALLVPIWSAPRKLASLQAILPTKAIGRRPRDGEPDERRDKDYLAGGAKRGCYFALGSIKPDTDLVLVCEGYATGATLHEAKGAPVMVAFDAGNLEPVAAMVRGKLPNARIVICADNDRFTTRPDGSAWNPGVEQATKAAEACAGVVAVPQFDENVPGRPTDFNDLHAHRGLDAVRSAIDLALNPPAPALEPEPAAAPAEAADAPVASAAPAGDDGDDAGIENNAHFTILGYNHDTYYIFQHRKKQIATITKADMGKTGLIALAELNWWEDKFGGSSKEGGIDLGTAANFIIRTAEKRGIYDPSHVRGRGAWVDKGRFVFHHGGYLTVDGMPTDITEIRSRYVYELSSSFPDPADEPLTSDEGEMLLDVANQFRWTKPGSAALLAGWVALAPVCGALRWRPHLWVTGGAGCGKSTILNDFVHYLLKDDLALYAQGSSTEAGIRQTLGGDARPVLFDESESNEETDIKRIQNVLSLIRQASTESEAKTLKGTAGGDAMSFHIRSMFCLASIQVGIKHQADIERLAILSLRPKREDDNAAGSWARLKGMLAAMRADVKLPSRLFRRALDLIPTTLKNIAVFTEVAAEKFNNVRDGDQYGTLLAGAWSLISTGVATREQALELINRYDWSEHRENNDMDEGQRALAALMEAHIKVHGGIEVTVYELLCAATGRPTAGVGVSSDTADSFLQRHGMKVKTHRLLLSNTSNELKRLMEGTPFAADLRGMLLRVPGVDKNDNKLERFSGVPAKCIALPLDPLVGSASRSAGAPPF